MNPLSTYGSALSSVFSKLAKNSARLGFEQQFNQIQKTAINRINTEIERIADEDDTPRKLANLEREYDKLDKKRVLIDDFYSDVNANKLRLEEMQDDVYAAIAEFSSEDDITNLTADEAANVSSKLDGLIENIEALVLTIHPDISQPHVVQDLKNQLDTLKSYTPVEGTIDAEDSGSPTNDNRNIYDTLSSLAGLIDTAATVTATTTENVSQISLRIQATLAEKVTDMTQLSNVELQRRQEKIDEVKADYGNMLRAISLSFEARMNSLEKLDESLNGQKIEPGSVLNLFTYDTRFFINDFAFYLGGSNVPLLIDFKAGDKLIINGSVLENIGSNTKILVHNKSAILREKEVLSQEDAQTPASRVYFELQNAYIALDSDERDGCLKRYDQRLNEFTAACPSASDIADKVRAHVEKDQVYKALKETQNLIKYESRVLSEFSEQLKAFLKENALDEELSSEADAPNTTEDEVGETP